MSEFDANTLLSLAPTERDKWHSALNKPPPARQKSTKRNHMRYFSASIAFSLAACLLIFAKFDLLIGFGSLSFFSIGVLILNRVFE